MGRWHGVWRARRARALWSAWLGLREAPLDIGETRSAAGRIALLSRAERSLFVGGISTTASAGLLVLNFPAGAPPSGQPLFIATLIFGFGATLSIIWVLEARERRSLALERVRASLGAGGDGGPRGAPRAPQAPPLATAPLR